MAIAISFYSSFFIELDFFGRTAISVASIAVFTIINYIGTKFGAKTQVWLSAITLLLLAIFIVLGFPNIELNNFEPWFPLGLGALGISLAFVLEPFIGWEGVTIISSEVKNARKLVPKAIALTTIAVAVIYILIMFVSLGAAGWETLAESSAPLAEAVGKFATFVVVMSLIINFAALNSWILTTSRLPYVMAKEKIFLKRFEGLSKYGTPGTSLLVQGVFAMIIALLGSYELSIFLLLSSALILYVLCFMSLIKLRKTHMPSFKVPKIFPFIAFGASIFLFIQIEWSIWITGVAIVLLGIPGYVAVKLTTDKEFVEKFWDKTSLVFEIYSPLVYRRRYIKKLLKKAGLKTNHVVLDYGSGTGKSTEEILKKVKKGKVVAADLSGKQIGKAFKKIKSNVCIPDAICIKLTKPAPFKRNTFDRIVCGLSINYFVDPKKELKALNRVLKKRGRAVFLAVSAPTIPLHDFLKNDRSTRDMMKKAGFRRISITREKRHFKEYIYIKAEK